MPCFITLVRAANVGGPGKLPMAILKVMGVEAGFGAVRIYIDSGNVVFTGRLKAPGVRRALEARLAAYAGQRVTVAVRTGGEMAGVLAANPSPDAAPHRTVAIFLNEPPPRDALARASGRRPDRLALGVRDIDVDFGEQMADSRLRFPGLEAGTARNMNTVARLASLAQAPTR